LDVHARSVVACAIDTVAGELIRSRLAPQHPDVIGWMRRLPGPVAVAYEAGPTGYGLARALAVAGVRCAVLAPSKLQRPAGERVQTDARDALHLARLLHLDEFTRVRVPSAAEEAARDLVRAREDVRGDLMRARHRVSKLLLRQGIVWSAAVAWRPAHHAWLAAQRFDDPALQAAYDSALETVVLAEGRRARWTRRSSRWPRTRRGARWCAGSAVCAESTPSPASPWRWRSASGSGSPGRVSAPASDWCRASPPAASPVPRARSPRRATPTPAGCWSRRPGTTASATGPGATIQARWQRASAAARARGHLGNQRLHQRWNTFTAHHKRPVVATVAVAREPAGWCWSLATLPD
jgi:hypothetical protein